MGKNRLVAGVATLENSANLHNSKMAAANGNITFLPYQFTLRVTCDTSFLYNFARRIELWASFRDLGQIQGQSSRSFKKNGDFNFFGIYVMFPMVLDQLIN